MTLVFTLLSRGVVKKPLLASKQSCQFRCRAWQWVSEQIKCRGFRYTYNAQCYDTSQSDQIALNSVATLLEMFMCICIHIGDMSTLKKDGSSCILASASVSAFSVSPICRQHLDLATKQFLSSLRNSIACEINGCMSRYYSSHLMYMYVK